MDVNPEDNSKGIKKNLRKRSTDHGFRHLVGPRSYHDRLKLALQREIDQGFMNDFVANVRKEVKPHLRRINISEGKKIFLEIISQRKKLETDISNLKPNDDNFDSKFNDLMKELNKTNEEINRFCAEVKDPLKSVIHKRMKKRERIKQRNMMYKALKEKKERDIEEKHKIIDKLLSEKSEEVEAAKREAALKRQADSVLHDVRRRKYEAKKMLNLLTALTKLRELRSAEAEKTGVQCSEKSTEVFNSVIERLRNLWEDQSDVYQLEEKGLKMMLVEGSLPHLKESDFEMNLLQWEEVLFGDVSNSEHEKILTAAGSDLQTLIQVRSEWDHYLVHDSNILASSIPIGWVLPPETDNEEWKAFIRTDKKNPL